MGESTARRGAAPGAGQGIGSAGGAATERVALPSGRRMAVSRHGTAGPTVVALHGIPGWRGTFDQLAGALAGRCRVVAPDLLGFGASDDAPGAHASAQAEAVLELLDALRLPEVHLVGFDFGGPTAVLAARRAPARVASLTLAATNLFPDTPVPVPLRVAAVPALGDLAFRLAFGRLGLAGMWLAAAGDRAAFPWSRYREALRFPAGVRSTRQVFLASLRDLPGLYGPVAAAGAALRLPAAVLWGDRDPFFPVEVGRRTAELLRAELRVLEGCGHFVPEERPRALAEAVLALVAAAAGRAGLAGRP